MIAVAWIRTTRSANRASLRSSSPPAMMATAVKFAGTTQAPLREKPPMMAMAALDVGSPPNRFTAALPAEVTVGAGGGTGPVCGRSRMIGSRSV